MCDEFKTLLCRTGSRCESTRSCQLSSPNLPTQFYARGLCDLCSARRKCHSNSGVKMNIEWMMAVIIAELC
jgi:hypothetical protein